jgi:hypothetical protein
MEIARIDNNLRWTFEEFILLKDELSTQAKRTRPSRGIHRNIIS